MAQTIHEIPGWPVDDLYRNVYGANDRTLERWGAIAAFVIGGLCMVVGATKSSSSDGMPASSWLFFGVLLVGAGAALIWKSRQPPAFVELFRSSVARIVWLYIKTIHVRGAVRGTRYELIVGLDDRSQHVIQVWHDDPEGALKRFSALAPQAASGYSPEDARAFAQDPRSLLRPKAVRRGGGLPG
jgi:hypothetical protein